MIDFEKENKRQERAEKATGFCVTEKVKVPNERGKFEDWVVAVLDKEIELAKIGDDSQIRKVSPEDLRAWQEQAERNRN
ncbi:MAG: hypothetical protein PHT40_01175 [Patescibacteria group bacterium]|nr:hypothetical protein [Patescibacteria group bacterium]